MAKTNTFKAVKAENLGTVLADAFHTAKQTRHAAQETFNARLGEIESTWITLLKAKAAQHDNMTAKDYDANVHPGVIARLETLGYKMARAVASQVKVAFLAFSHGIEVKPEYASNFQNFVNKQARPELGAMKVIAHTPKGPKGKTEAKPAPGPVDMFANLFKGDKTARAWRIEALRAIVSADPSAKLFDSVLSDMLDTLEIEV
jgi:hypothetical protein